MSGGTPLGQGPRRRLCIDDERKVVVKALADAEAFTNGATRAVERGRKRIKRTKQKRIKLLAMGKLKERMRNKPFDQRLAVLDARIVELKRELKAAKLKWRAASARRATTPSSPHRCSTRRKRCLSQSEGGIRTAELL